METLMQEINDLLEKKNTEISLLKWENEKFKKENAELRRELEYLSTPIMEERRG